MSVEGKKVESGSQEKSGKAKKSAMPFLSQEEDSFFSTYASSISRHLCIEARRGEKKGGKGLKLVR